jgi:hypothetical protein
MAISAGELKQLGVVLIANDPTATDDRTKGFFAGSTAFSIATSTLWICTASGPGVAAWDLVPFGGGGTINSGNQYRLPYYSTNPSGTTLSEAAAITGNRALISDANGVPAHSATTSAQLGYLQGISSPSIGDLFYFDGTNIVKLAAGAAGQPLLGNGAAAPVWGTVSVADQDITVSAAVVGFSALTTNVVTYSFNPQTKQMTISFAFSGTSDNTVTTFTVPQTAPAYDQNILITLVTNNGSTSTTPGRIQWAAGTTTITLTRDRVATAWTNSGTKSCSGNFTFITA